MIRLWEYFDEAMEYEEDPSGVHAGLVAIKTKRESEYRAYESCRNQINGLTKGQLKVHRQKGIRIVQTLFLYYIAHRDINGLSVEKIANSVMIERQPDATPEENLQHYETLAEALKNELRQIVQSFDEDNNPLYRFEPVVVGIDPQREFLKARDEAESNEAIQKESWEALLSMEKSGWSHPPDEHGPGRREQVFPGWIRGRRKRGYHRHPVARPPHIRAYRYG